MFLQNLLTFYAIKLSWIFNNLYKQKWKVPSFPLSKPPDNEPDGSLILEEDFDENYEPTNEEIEDYANYIGMRLPQDKHLLWIAREGLKTKLPDNWRPC